MKRKPKVFVTDPGLAAWLLGKSATALEDPTDPTTGQLVETFEAADGRVAGVEVKAATTPRRDWFRWLELMRDRLGPTFVAGLVLYAR